MQIDVPINNFTPDGLMVPREHAELESLPCPLIPAPGYSIVVRMNIYWADRLNSPKQTKYAMRWLRHTVADQLRSSAREVGGEVNVVEDGKIYGMDEGDTGA